ncbi:hypothetical protein Gohar_009351 [Gossypium harknessii]|uniref:Dehydrogenase E1 component domain-containing protein n=1 Tax=Gossypium harknessii TaxID=34285 RepID=A0A7J9GMK1_9ROSI|nr:hypothetical protein [Gossypium harknessii]
MSICLCYKSFKGFVNLQYQLLGIDSCADHALRIYGNYWVADKFAFMLIFDEKMFTILEMDTYRYHGHSMSDPGSTYRTRDEITGVRQERDPVERIRKLILSHDLATEKELKDIEKEIRKEVDDAIAQAKENPLPESSELFTNVYAKGLGVEVYHQNHSSECTGGHERVIYWNILACPCPLDLLNGKELPSADVYKLDENSASAKPTRIASYGNELKPQERLSQYQKALVGKPSTIPKRRKAPRKGHTTSILGVLKVKHTF